MKTKYLKYINTFAIALPIMLLLTYPIFDAFAIAFALLAVGATGFIQFCLATKMLVDNPKDPSIHFYMIGCGVFFLLWLRNQMVGYDNFLTVVLVIVPFLLSFYLSFLIYTKR